ncbi:capsular biosynthesis protein [Clostridium sp. CM028]|uniref:YveK family protein n=1 Tax=Clostridium sp. CM028 TaxID=2851575 RepID=UPI001C6E042C|nr:Wzz/FepE/Etk N-terminal domain-containing protein [Clostridium sp. CM028]MBW9148481.1 capsular biosynthesis protein [Clostridium sp. CM028]WLC61054.1 capsular biosynthesis protein [Clostridium sp. CM028]
MDQEMDISLKEIFIILKERLWLIVSITVAAIIIAGIMSFYVIKPTYEAKTSVIIGKPQSTASGSTQYNDVKMYQDLVETYSKIAQSELVAQGALDELKGNLTLNQIKDSITVTPQAGTQILIISAKSKSPQEALKVINAISTSFIESSKKVYPIGGEIQVMDKANMPTNPISPNKVRNMAIGFLIGLIISVGLVFILEYSDNTIKTESDVEIYIGLPILGVIPKMTAYIK